MAGNPTVWGIHMGRHVGDRPVEENYVAIGWAALGDLFKIEPTREAFKEAMIAAYPDKKAGAIPVDAGTTFKFACEIVAGDYVVYPSKADRRVNVGRFTSKSAYFPNDPDSYPNRRTVEWLGHFPRNELSQSALNEIGSFVTLFKVRRNALEFLAKINAHLTANVSALDHGDSDVADEIEDDDTATVSVSKQAEETTDDFIVRRIMAQLDGYQFEEFVAHILECMGYTARVTQKSGDGGVDVIAHMDALGFQPPIVKVQCKRTTGQHGPAEVNQLNGTLGEGEFGLFVTLGSFCRAAAELERNRPKLRLIDGDAFVELVLEHYSSLSPRYRSLIPLKQIYVPDLAEP